MINLVTSEKKVYFTKLTLLNWRRRFSIRVLCVSQKEFNSPSGRWSRRSKIKRYNEPVRT